MEFKQKQKNAEILTHKEEELSLQKSEQKQEQINAQEVTEKSEADFSEGFKESTMKDDIDELGGPSPDEPQFIGLEKKYAAKKENDSPKMQAVRDAIAAYHDPESYRMTETQALDNLIKACDRYCRGRFRIFKRGDAKKRLEEVMALRERAEQKKQAVLSERKDGIEHIYNAGNYEFYNTQVNATQGANLGKKIVGGVVAFFNATVGNVFRLVTLQPLWKGKIHWRSYSTYYETIKFLDRTFGREKKIERVDEQGHVIEGEYDTVKQYETSTSHKDKLKSKTLAAEEAQMKSYEAMKEQGIFDDFDEDAYMDHGYLNDDKLKEAKRDLIKEYQKQPRNQEAIDYYEKQIEERQHEAEKFLAYMTKYKPTVGYNIDDHTELDVELSKIRINDFKLNSQKPAEDNPAGTYAKAMHNESWFSVASAPAWIKQEHLDSGSIPEELVDQKIEESYQLFFDEEISVEEKTRLKKDFQKRFNLSLMAAKTYQMANIKTEDRVPYIRKGTAAAESFSERDQLTLMRELPNIMLIMKDMTKEEKLEYEEEIAEASEEKQAELIQPFILKALDMKDLSKYEYKDEEDLIAKYNVFLDEFQYGFVLNTMVTQYLDLGGTLTEEQELHARTVAETLCCIKSHYEMMLHILASPNYSLLGDTVEKYYNPKKEKDYDAKYEDLMTRVDAQDMVTQDYLSSQRIFEEKGKKKNKQGMGFFHGNDAMSTFKVFKEFVKNDMKEHKENAEKRKKAKK